MPANVSITPQTVPSNPMNGPPATAVESTIIPFSNDIACATAASSSTTFTASNDAVLTFVVLVRADDPCDRRRFHGLLWAPLPPDIFQVIRDFLRAARVKLIRWRAVEFIARF